MKIVVLLSWILWLTLMTGWLSHRSLEPEIGPWSSGYALFLVVAAGSVVVPLFLTRMRRRLGDERSLALVVRGGAVLVVFWLLASKVHQAGQTHDFDPYFQIGPPMSDYPQRPSAATTRILCLGGSTTRGPKLEFDERYPARLERLFNESGYAVEVINGGMYWYTSKHSQMAWTFHWRDYRPDIVVIMHAYNDMTRSFSAPGIATGPYRTDWAHYYGPAYFGARPATFEAWLADGPLSLACEAWGSRWRTTWVPAGPEVFRSLPEFRELYDDLAAEIAGDGPAVVLVTQPHRFGSIGDDERMKLWTTRRLCARAGPWGTRTVPDPASVARAMGDYNDVVRAVAGARGMLLVDAEDALTPDDDHFDDGLHHRAPGADALARRISELLQGHALLERFRVSPPGS